MKPIELRGHERPINCIKINFDGDLFFSGGADSKVNLWSSYTGERIGSYTIKSAVKSLDVTKDSDLLIVGSLQGTIEFFKVQNAFYHGILSSKSKVKYLELSYGDDKLVVVALSLSLHTSRCSNPMESPLAARSRSTLFGRS